MPVRTLKRALVAAALCMVTAAPAAAAPEISTARGCYLVGQRVSLTGSGFAPNRKFEVSIDGVDFGTSTTDGSGGFTASLRPGGLGANEPQLVDHLAASDGSTTARTAFTVTRTAGARFLASGGNARRLKAKFEVWGFSLTGRHVPLYLHYVSGAGRLKKTVSLGRAGGQCGYLLTRARRVFPFAPSAGRWTFQIDTHHGYARKPTGPVTRIGVQIG